MIQFQIPAAPLVAGFFFFKFTQTVWRAFLKVAQLHAIQGPGMASTLLFFSFFFLVSPLGATGTTALTGTVTDTSGFPVVGASVQLPKQLRGTVTDISGRFTFSDLPAGDYALEISHLNFKSKFISKISLAVGFNKHLRIALEEEILILPQSEVYANQNTSSQLAEKVIVHQSQWNRNGAQTVGEVLDKIPGVTLLSGDGRERISIQGAPGRAVRVFYDGIPLNDAGTGEATLEGVNLESLQAIEVEFQGYGGIVHLCSYHAQPNPKPLPALRIIGNQGSFGSYAGYLSLDLSQKKLGSGFNLQRKQESGDFPYRLDNGDRHRRINNQAFLNSANVHFRINYPNRFFRIGLYREQAKRGIPGLIHTAPTPEADLSRSRISLGLNGQYTARLFHLEASAYYSDYAEEFTNPAEQFNPATGATVYQIAEHNRQQGERWGLRTTGMCFLSQGSLRLGYELQQDEFLGLDLLRGITNIGGIGFGSAQRKIHQVFCDYKYRREYRVLTLFLSPQFSYQWIANNRLNPYEFLNQSLSTGLSKNFIWGALTLNFNWSKDFSAPPFNALFAVENVFAVGNKNLKPEQGESIRSGLNFRNPPGSLNDWSFSLNHVRNKTEDLIVWRRNSFGKYYPDNLSRVLSNGLELSANLKILKGSVTLEGNYIYNDPKIVTPGDINYGHLPPLIPHHQTTLGLIGDWDQNRINLRFRSASRRYSTESNLDPISTADMGLAPYQVFDFYFSREWTFKRFTMIFESGLDNIFNEQYRIIERSPMPGRTYRLRLEFQI